MKKNKILIIGAVIVAVGFALFLSSTHHRGDMQKSGKIRIGALLTMTGNLSAFGESQKHGIDLAVDFLRGKGVDVSVVVEDSAGLPRNGVSAARKLIETDKVDAIVASVTGVIGAVVPLVKNAGVPFACYSMEEGITKNISNAVRFYPANGQQVDMLVKALEKLKAKNVAIVHFNNEVHGATAMALQNKLKVMGNVNVKTIAFTDQQEQYKNIAAQLVDGEVVVFLGYHNYIQAIGKAIVTAKKNNVILGGIDVPMAVTYGGMSPNDLEGFISVLPNYPTSPTNIFGEKVKEKYLALDLGGRYAFDSIIFLAKFFGAKGVSDLQLARWAESVDPMQGLTGTFHFAPSGELMCGWDIYIYRNGELTHL